MDLSYLQNESQANQEQKTETETQKNAPGPRKASGLVYETQNGSQADIGGRGGESVFSPNQYSLSTVEYAELREQPPDSESDSPMEHDYDPQVNSVSKLTESGYPVQKSSKVERSRDNYANSRTQDTS